MQPCSSFITTQLLTPGLRRTLTPPCSSLHHHTCHLRMQDVDTDAADKALQPAFAAINANLHKQQPSACGGNCSPTQLPFFLRYSAAWVYAAMATTGVSLMEKRKQWQQAVDLLQQLLGEPHLHTLILSFHSFMPTPETLTWGLNQNLPNKLKVYTL